MRFEVPIAEEQLERLEGLQGAWSKYLEMLQETGARLEKHKDAFREKVGALMGVSVGSFFEECLNCVWRVSARMRGFDVKQ
jgi:hypothetical protein